MFRGASTLKQSQAYPANFGVAVAKAWLQHRAETGSQPSLLFVAQLDPEDQAVASTTLPVPDHV